jgi:hypothetical protein
VSYWVEAGGVSLGQGLEHHNDQSNRSELRDQVRPRDHRNKGNDPKVEYGDVDESHHKIIKDVENVVKD